jgi:hypothetical protein
MISHGLINIKLKEIETWNIRSLYRASQLKTVSEKYDVTIWTEFISCQIGKLTGSSEHVIGLPGSGKRWAGK